jgi:hypothetical protein
MITPSGKAATIGRLIGWVAVVAALAFIGLQLWHRAPWQLAAAHLPSLTAAVVTGALLYGMGGFLLSSAWRCLLGAEPSTASARWHHAVYGRTQIAKYLPGNVFHLVGRQVMGRRLGHGQARLALASLVEAILLLSIAGALTLPIVWRSLDQILLRVLVPAGLALVLMVAPWLYRHRHRRFYSLGDKVERATSQATLSTIRRLLAAGLLYAAFFAVVAAIFWMLAWSVADSGGPSIDLITSISVVALAWLVGFATPGSSAGIGVREAVLIAALEGTLGMPASTLIALALRLVSIAGDVIFFALSAAIAPTGDGPRAMMLRDYHA